MSGNIESDLLSPEDRWRQFVLHQPLKEDFLVLSADFEMHGKGRCEFDNPVIEERRTHLYGVRHAHSIHLGENIIREKVLLVEPQVSRRVVSRPRDPGRQLADDFLKCAG